MWHLVWGLQESAQLTLGTFIASDKANVCVQAMLDMEGNLSVSEKEFLAVAKVGLRLGLQGWGCKAGAANTRHISAKA